VPVVPPPLAVVQPSAADMARGFAEYDGGGHGSHAEAGGAEEEIPEVVDAAGDGSSGESECDGDDSSSYLTMLEGEHAHASAHARRVGEPMLSSSRLRIHARGADAPSAGSFYRSSSAGAGHSAARRALLSGAPPPEAPYGAAAGDQYGVYGFEADLEEDGLLGLQHGYGGGHGSHHGHHHHHHHLPAAGVPGMCSPVSEDGDSDEGYDGCREVCSDVDEDVADYLPELLGSDHGDDDIQDLISDEERELLDEAYLEADSAERECGHFASAPLPGLHRELRHLGLHHHVAGGAHHHHDHGAFMLRGEAGGGEGEDGEVGEGSGSDREDYYGEEDYAAADARYAEDEMSYFTYRKRLDDKFRTKERIVQASAEPDFGDATDWPLGLDLYGASFFSAGVFSEGKQPDDKTRRILQDKEWVDSMLAALPGVDPEDLRIQSVLANLRGTKAPVVAA